MKLLVRYTFVLLQVIAFAPVMSGPLSAQSTPVSDRRVALTFDDLPMTGGGDCAPAEVRDVTAADIEAACVADAFFAARGTPADSAYYDFWIGEWHQVIDGRVADQPRFVVTKGLYPSALEEEWQMEGYKAKGWRAWDASTNTWTFVWISERGHFQVWDERKVGDAWYMYKVFMIEGDRVLSRQAFLPQEDGSVIRTSEHSRDGGATWVLRFEERYVQPEPSAQGCRGPE